MLDIEFNSSYIVCILYVVKIDLYFDTKTSISKDFCKMINEKKESRKELFLKFIPFILLMISALLLGVGVYYTYYALGYDEASNLGAVEALHGRSITIAVVAGTVFLAFWSIFYILVKRKKS